MIIGLIGLGLGIAGAVAVLLLRKKMTKAWLISLLAAAVLLATVGGIFTADAVSRNNQDKRSIDMALHYLEHRYTTEAAYYLKQVQTDSVCSLGTETLLEIMRGNEMLAQFKQDALNGKAKTDAERSLCLKLSAVNIHDGNTQTAVIQSLRDALKLSKGQAEKVSRQFSMESGCYVEGVELDESELNEEEALRLKLNRFINNGDYYNAIVAAASLVKETPNAKNRLLLAELVAEAAYSGYYLEGWEFAQDAKVMESAEAQRTKLREKKDSLELKLTDTRVLLESAKDEATVQGLQNEINELTAQIQEVQDEIDYLFLERAFNSIADIFSLEAGVVRARLEFARKNYQGAMEQLEKTVKNPIIRMSVTGEVKNAVNILRKAVSSNQAAAAQTPEFQDAMNTLVSSVGSEMVAIYSGDLSKDLAEYVVSDQKVFGKDLFITKVDTSAYPQVTITLSGRDSIIDKIIAKKEVIIRDTHTPVTYTVTVPDGTEAIADICCVVDESGSMEGSPMENLKNALSGFISRLKDSANIGIVGFENTYTIHCEVGNDHNKAAAAVSNLHAYGGTEITEGIRGAVEAMKNCTGQKTILLMTDGQSSVDMSVVEQAAKSGHVIHCIGFGGVNDSLLQSIADATGGQYIRADSSAELINVYMSLVGVIGNQVKITYTVDQVSTTEEVRYFFVRDPDSDTNIRVDYVPLVLQQPQINSLSKSQVTMQELKNIQQYGTTLDLTLYGQNLMQVASVTVGGLNGQILEQSDGYLRLALEPKLTEGWNDIVLTDSGQNQFTYHSMLLVTDETLRHGEFELNGMQIYCNDSVLTDDDMLIMTGRIRLLDDENGMELYIEGLLQLEVNGRNIRKQLQNGGTVELPKDAELKGSGKAYLGSTDSGYLNYGNSFVAQGTFHFERSDGWFHIVQD